MGAFRGEVVATLGGQQVRLVLDFNAICDVEAAAGVPAPVLFERFEGGGAGFQDLRTMLWAVSQRHQPHLTPREIGDLIGADLDAARDALQQVMTAAQPAGKGQAPGKKPTTRRR